MYRLIEPSAIACVNIDDEATELYRRAWTSTDNTLILRAGALAGYVYPGHLARTYAPGKTIADYCLAINSVRVPSSQAASDDLIAVQRAAHQELMRLFTRSSGLRYVPIVDEHGHVLAAARRLRPDRQWDTLLRWLRCGGESAHSLLGEYLRTARGIKTVAVWCDATPLGQLLIRELLDSPDVKLTHIVSDYSFIDADGLTSVGSDEVSQIDAGAIIAATWTNAIPDCLRARRPRAIVMPLDDLMEHTVRWAFETRALLDQAIRLRRRGVGVHIISAPHVRRIKNPSEREQQILDDWRTPITQVLSQDAQRYAYRIEPVRSDHYTLEDYIRLIVACPPITIPRNGYTINADIANPYFHYRDGRRLVPDAPAVFANTLWILGDSSATNYYGDDSETIAAHLQKLVNERFGDEAYRVVDMATNAQRKDETARLIDDLELVPGDHVFLIAGGNLDWGFESSVRASGVPYEDLSHLFDRPHDMGEVFVWSGQAHLNGLGQEVVARELARLVFDTPAAPAPVPAEAPSPSRHRILVSDTVPVQYTPEFAEYLRLLDEIRIPCEGRVGGIVVNCNPFTLGHRYLIETSAAKVDHLYVFVVEEDQSIFPFTDRIELVRQGTADLPNVTVLPSGRFIISSLTFPEYFRKSEDPDAVVDPSRDVALFARYIAKELGITIRFVGEEPLDRVTRQYNATMARVLPANGVEFDVIPRKESAGAPISASRVRALLDQRDFDAIAQIVPPTTLAYLRTFKPRTR